MTRAVLLFLTSFLLAQSLSPAANAHESANRGDTYVIYLHGAIIESMGRRPTHPRFGIYEYDQVLKSLEAEGRHVISEARPKGTKVDDYASHLAEQIQALLDDGVPAQNITVIGFSKGGMIALRTSDLMQEPALNFAFLAACNPRNRAAGLHISGRTLSIIETTDSIGTTCMPLQEAAKEGSSLTEITISTGKEHGAFYTPDPAWLMPLLAWMNNN